MIRWLKKISRFVLLIGLGLVLGVALLEGLLRLAGFKSRSYYRQFTRFHPVLGWEKTPGIEGSIRKGETTIHEKMNSYGWRDIEYAVQKPEKTIRLLVLGDSFTEGYDVQFEELFTERLEKKLNDSASPKTGLRYEVINTGTGGYSTDQEYLVYLTQGKNFDPDIVLLMTYPANDVYYNVKEAYGNYKKPLFVERDSVLSLTNTPLPQPPGQESFKRAFRDLVVYQMSANLILTRFPSVTRWLHRMGFVSESTLNATTARAGIQQDSLRPASSFSVYEREDSPFMKQAWQITEHLLRNLNDSVRQDGGRLVMFGIPDPFEIDEDVWQQTQANLSVDDRIWNIHKPNLRLSGIADRYGIRYLDFSEYLKQKGMKARTLHNIVHWNAQGNAVVADFIYHELDRSGWLSGTIGQK